MVIEKPPWALGLVLSALPLSLVGAIGGLYLFHATLSVPSFIGIIAVSGLIARLLQLRQPVFQFADVELLRL